MRGVYTSFPFLLILISTLNIKAQREYIQPIQDVFQSELVYPQEKNEVQLTIVPFYHEFGSNNYFQIPIMAEYGITNSWQLELEWNAYQRFKNTETLYTGIGDLEIGMMYSFMSIANSNLHAAAGFDLAIPFGSEDKGLSEGVFEFEPYISLAKDFPKLHHSQLFMHAGVSFSETDEDEYEEITLNGGFFVPLKYVVFTSELSIFSNQRFKNDDYQLYYTPGFIVTSVKGWEGGLGFPIGINSLSDSFGVMLMLTYEFDILDKDD